MSSSGPRVAAFAERYIRQSKGRWAGQPLIFEGWQRALLDELFLLDGSGQFVYKEALLGVPRKNGKSTLCAGLALYGLVGLNEPGAEVYCAAASKDQARVVFNQAKAFIEASPRLQDWLRPYKDVILCDAIGGIYRVLAADAALQHGLNPSMVVIDELHAHKDPELYYALTTGQLARDNPLVVSITTAGFDKSTICGQVYEHGKGLADRGLDAMREAGFLFKWFQAPEEAGIDDRDSWRLANPSSWIDIEDLARERQRLPEHVFRRLHLNQWTASEEAWLPAGAWQQCYEGGAHIPHGAEKVYLGVDIGIKRDHSAVVAVWQRDDGKVVTEAQVFAPPQDGPLDLSVVDQAIRAAADRWQVHGVVYDRWSFEHAAQQLSDEGLLMIEFPLSNERTVPASARLYEAVTGGEIVHNGDSVFAAHVEAGAVKQTERGWRLTKSKAKKQNDALIALMVAFQTMSQQEHSSNFLTIL